MQCELLRDEGHGATLDRFVTEAVLARLSHRGT